MYQHPSMQGEVCFDDEWGGGGVPVQFRKVKLNELGPSFGERRRALMAMSGREGEGDRDRENVVRESVARELNVDECEEDDVSVKPTTQCCNYKELYDKEKRRNAELQSQHVVLLGFLDKFISKTQADQTPPHLQVSPIPSSSPSLSSVVYTPPSCTKDQKPFSTTSRKHAVHDGAPQIRCPRLA